MSVSCHFNRASNDEFSVDSNFEYLLLLCFLTVADLKKNQNKHSKLDTKFIIQRPV